MSGKIDVNAVIKKIANNDTPEKWGYAVSLETSFPIDKMDEYLQPHFQITRQQYQLLCEDPDYTSDFCPPQVILRNNSSCPVLVLPDSDLFYLDFEVYGPERNFEKRLVIDRNKAYDFIKTVSEQGIKLYDVYTREVTD